MSYEIGQHVELKSGKQGTIDLVVSSDVYRVKLDDGGRVRVPAFEITRLCGCQRLNVTAGRRVIFTPTEEEKLTRQSLRTLTAAYDDAVEKLVKAKIALANDLLALSDDRPASLQLRLAARVFFQLTPDASAEDYRRLIAYTNKVIGLVFSGITQDNFVLCETDAKAMKLSNDQMVAGYVRAGTLEGLAMLLWGGSAHQRFKSVQPMSGEVHINLNDFVKMPWQISATIIHEATHKFCKTVDVHYFKPSLCTSVQTFIKLTAMGGGNEGLLDQAAKMIRIQDPELLPLTGAELINNADSFAYFIMLMGE